MSVPSWKRKLSETEYVYRIYILNIRLGELLINKPQKYKLNYTDSIIKTALSALEHVKIADDIKLDKSVKISKTIFSKDYCIKRENLLLAKGKIDDIATKCFIYLEIVRKHDYSSDCKKQERYFAKLYDQEMQIGEMCDECIDLLDAEIESDKKIYKKYVNLLK